MEVRTSRFGTVSIDEDKLIHFPLGLLGFERYARYFILDSEPAEPMRYLQSVDEPGLALLIVEPQLFFADYRVLLDDSDRELLELKDDSEWVAACVVVVPGNPKDMTINLLAPLVMNADKRLGKQVVMHQSGYSPNQRLLADAQTEELALA